MDKLRTMLFSIYRLAAKFPSLASARHTGFSRLEIGSMTGGERNLTRLKIVIDNLDEKDNKKD
jgi:hypothetical protein